MLTFQTASISQAINIIISGRIAHGTSYSTFLFTVEHFSIKKQVSENGNGELS